MCCQTQCPGSLKGNGLLLEMKDNAAHAHHCRLVKINTANGKLVEKSDHTLQILHS